MAFDITILEFPKILKRVQRYAESATGKAACLDLAPFDDESILNERLGEVSEAYKVFQNDMAPTFGGVHDIKTILKRASIGAVIEPSDILMVHAQLDNIPAIKRQFSKAEETLETALTLTHYTEELYTLGDLKKSIEGVIDTRGNVRDDASSKLRDLRTKLNQTKRAIQQTLNDLTNSQSDKLTEKLYTVRYERYVLPVKLSEKNNVKGTVVDYSASGETVYVEPQSIRNLSAKRHTLTTDEQKEVERILYAMSARIAKDRDALLANLEILTHLDVCFAKAAYGHALECSIPVIQKGIHLIKARHPLLDQRSVVANTITFDEDVTQMVITGSNTGGKTVTLKTLGIVSLMAQSGMMIPALPGSHIQMFDGVRADIGDEQSIEQSLSTFSSHMSNIVDIVNNFADNQLILLDELGSGTDPKEGSSLAMSILDYLSTHESYVIATTHYPELKAYAYTKSHVMNASVEFDEATLKPTYKLRLRTPGESHAFLISHRLGLNESIIETAKANVLTEQDEVSDLIDDLKRQSALLEDDLENYEQLNKDLEKEKAAVIEEKRTLQKRRETLKEEVTKQNAKTINELKSRAQTLIDELSSMRDTSFKEHELAEKKHDVKQLSQGNQTPTSAPSASRAPTPGDRVYIKPYNRYGEILSKQKDGRFKVAMGTLESVFESDALEVSQPTPTNEQTTTPTGTTPKAKKQVASSLDLRGMRVHEANDALEKFLDDAAMSAQPYATIIHGFGTMAVRTMVKNVVQASPVVTSHRDGGNGEGGQGATVVYFE